MKIVQVEEHKGLTLKSCELLDEKVIAVIGRNGAGKSRLFQAIEEGKIRISTEIGEIKREHIRHLTAQSLEPIFIFGFNAVAHQQDINAAKAVYRDYRQSREDRQQGSIGSLRIRHAGSVNISDAIFAASRATGKEESELEEQDIADYYFGNSVPLGGLSVTATMLMYLTRVEGNNYNEFRNKTYGGDLPHHTDEEFKLRFGSPPWEVLNDVFKLVFDGKYQVKVPVFGDTDGYEARLTRPDGKEIDPGVLSSGEKVLLWLSLCMYSVNSIQVGRMPKLLLLDEPDATLHPGMIQSLHRVLNAMAKKFNCNIIFTTHSPTTVALFNGPIYRISEHELLPVDNDVAISELLVGVDQVSIYFSNRRQVYVESNDDAKIYSNLFRLLKQWHQTSSAHISLSFVAAAPKLSETLIRDDLKAVFNGLDADQVNSYIEKVNGHGNDVSVVGTVETLEREENDSVYGIIDWDTKNTWGNRIFVHGAGIFYSMANAILNPLTLGFYLLQNFHEKIDLPSLDLAIGFDLHSLYIDHTYWQTITDAVTKKILEIDDPKHDIECSFVRGEAVKFDKRYVHKNGHDLQKKVLKSYPFLDAVRRSLMLEVVKKGIETSHGRTLPSTFKDLFGAIQLAGQTAAADVQGQVAAMKPIIDSIKTEKRRAS